MQMASAPTSRQTRAMRIRFRGTPDEWQPSADTVRAARRGPVLGPIILFVFGAACALAAVAGGVVLVGEMIRWGRVHLLFWVFLLFVAAAGALMLWLSSDWIDGAEQLLEIDFRARRFFAQGARPPIGSFDEIQGIAVVSVNLTVVTTSGRDVIGTSVRFVDRLVILPSGRQLYEDVAGVGEVRKLAAHLSRATGVPIVEVKPDAPAPLPRGLAPGAEVWVQLEGREPQAGYVTQGTFRGAPSPSLPNVVVLLRYGGTVTVPPHALRPRVG